MEPVADLGSPTKRLRLLLAVGHESTIRRGCISHRVPGGAPLPRPTSRHHHLGRPRRPSSPVACYKAGVALPLGRGRIVSASGRRAIAPGRSRGCGGEGLRPHGQHGPDRAGLVAHLPSSKRSSTGCSPRPMMSSSSRARATGAGRSPLPASRPNRYRSGNAVALDRRLRPRHHHHTDAEAPGPGPMPMAKGWSHQGGGRHQCWVHAKRVVSEPNSLIVERHPWL